MVKAWRDIRVWGALLVAVLALAAFSVLPGLGFVRYDDGIYVVQNEVVGRGLTLEGVRWAFTTFTASNWHPLTWVSHLLDVSLYGLRPGGHHVTSLLLHAVSGVLLFLALARLTRAPWPSLAVALLWVVHPLRVESVAWISERKDVLSTFFALLTLWLYARYAERPSPRRMAVVVATFTMGLLAKPMLVTLPCVLLLLDYWPLGRWRPPPASVRVALRKLPLAAPCLPPGGESPPRDKRSATAWLSCLAAEGWPLVREKRPLFLLAALAAGMTLVAQHGGKAMRDLEEVPPFWRVMDALWDTFAYVRQTVWPVDLTALYPYTSEWLTPGALVLALTVVILGFWTAWSCRCRWPWVTVGWLWYVGMLFPVSGIIPIGAQAQADRYSYLPQIGLLILGVWSGRQGLCRVAGGGVDNKLRQGDACATMALRRVRLWGGAAVATATAVLAAMTWVQVGFWRDSTALFASAVDAYPDNYMARYALGIALVQADRPADAEAHLVAAAGIAPQFPGHFYALAVSLSRQDRHAEAVREYRRVLLMTPDDAKTHHMLGVEFYKMGRWKEAVRALKSSVGLRPEVAESRLLLAWWLATDVDPARRDGAEAVRQARTVCQTGEGKLSPSAWNTLAAALAETGQFPAAVAAAHETIRLTRSAGNEVPAVLNEHLAAYERHQPWREPPAK